jgi:hypothetical protein
MLLPPPVTAARALVVAAAGVTTCPGTPAKAKVSLCATTTVEEDAGAATTPLLLCRPALHSAYCRGLPRSAHLLVDPKALEVRLQG